MFRLKETEGVRVFRDQPRFVRYRLVVADSMTTIAFAEWESKELDEPCGRAVGAALPGVAKEQRDAEKLSLETYDGEVGAAS